MPKVREVACRNADCDVDMFSIHYDAYVPDEEYVPDYACPGCGEREALSVLGE